MNVENFPSQPTSFIGRSEDVAELLRLLTDPNCRLLTVIGAGGIGKTRLAIQAINALKQDFAHGVYFIPLQAATSLEGLISAVADGLKFPLSGRDSPRLQLLNNLRNKSLLLLLDNFEQLLEPGGALFLADILEISPSIKLLTTSREVLNLQEEWLYPVQGLAYPDDSDDTGDISAYDAVQLFVERARRVRPDFSIADERASLTRICRLVEGMPLAIELAASWTRTMPCRVIAAEIERNLNFLTTTSRNAPEQHRSMQAVFDHSWSLLTETERQAFKRLSIFRGGFWREAAEHVAGASLFTLSALVDKSLLRWDTNGRYQIHELLRQYAEDQLYTSAEEPDLIRNLHCAYFANFLDQRQDGIKGGRQRDVIAEIMADLDNVRAAWQWAIDHSKVSELHKSAITLDLFFHMTSRYLEGADAFEKAIQSLDRVDPGEARDMALAVILISQGWYGIRLGQFQQAEALFERGRTILERRMIPPPPGVGTDPRLGLGTLANIQGNYAEAMALSQEARQDSHASGHSQNLMVSYYVLTNAALGQGQYESARDSTRQAYALAKSLNDHWMSAYILIDIGHVAKALGDYDQARQHYQAAYDLRQEFDDPEGMAVALNHLGEVARLQKDHQTAESLYRQSLVIYLNIGDNGGLAAALHGLGQVASARADHQAAQDYFQQALQITSQIQFMPLTLAILVSVGEFLFHTRRPLPGLTLLTFVQDHPAANQETKARAQRSLADYAAEINPDDLVTADQRAQDSNLETMVAAIQAQLTAPIEPDTALTDKQALASSLIEPLTDRELEVLGLMAQGLSNPEIAEKLILAVGTVKYYTAEIYGKLGVHNRVQAITRGRELKLL